MSRKLSLLQVWILQSVMSIATMLETVETSWNTALSNWEWRSLQHSCSLWVYYRPREQALLAAAALSSLEVNLDGGEAQREIQRMLRFQEDTNRDQKYKESKSSQRISKNQNQSSLHVSNCKGKLQKSPLHMFSDEISMWTWCFLWDFFSFYWGKVWFMNVVLWFVWIWSILIHSVSSICSKRRDLAWETLLHPSYPLLIGQLVAWRCTSDDLWTSLNIFELGHEFSSVCKGRYPE